MPDRPPLPLPQSGAEIVEELCSNSATFEAKTEFSQDKYKRKKAKKYIMYIVIRCILTVLGKHPWHEANANLSAAEA